VVTSNFVASRPPETERSPECTLKVPQKSNPHQRMRWPSSLATRLTALMRVLKKEWKPPQCAIMKSPCGFMQITHPATFIMCVFMMPPTHALRFASFDAEFLPYAILDLSC